MKFSAPCTVVVVAADTHLPPTNSAAAADRLMTSQLVLLMLAKLFIHWRTLDYKFYEFFIVN